MDVLIAGKKVLYGWLGVSIQDIDQKLADYFGLPDKKGVLVAKVLPDSPAEKDGLKDGDIIKRFNGKDVVNLKSLLKQVARVKVGSKASIEVIRDKKPVTVQVEIGERPSSIEEESAKLPSEETWRGLGVSGITQELAQKYNIRQARGVVVIGVEPDSPADEAGIIVGDVIDAINNRPIRNINDYNIMTSAIKGKALVRTARGFTVVKDEN